MIEVIVDGKTARENLFDTREIIGWNHFSPKNNEIKNIVNF